MILTAFFRDFCHTFSAHLTIEKITKNNQNQILTKRFFLYKSNFVNEYCCRDKKNMFKSIFTKCFYKILGKARKNTCTVRTYVHIQYTNRKMQLNYVRFVGTALCCTMYIYSDRFFAILFIDLQYKLKKEKETNLFLLTPKPICTKFKFMKQKHFIQCLS